MPKWIANYFGEEVGINSTKQGIFTLHEQYLFSSESSWPKVFLITGGSVSSGAPGTPASGYTIHQFTTTGPATFQVSGAPPTFSADLLLVGGGGSGFGGGGGGVVYHPNIPITDGTYAVVVGAGGGLVGCNNGTCSPNPTPSGIGQASSFGPYSIPGGSINPGAFSPAPLGNQGPGGGSGGPNHDALSRDGGNGTQNSILGTNYYWGGGGGGGGNNSPGGNGGLGGGGGGGSNNGSGGSGGGSALNTGTNGGRTGPSTPTSPGGDGGTNTGGGGGGGFGGSRGGPGIVIVRYIAP